MSGGVDSSVAAYLLKSKGFHTAGVTMCFGIKDAEGKKPRCCGAEAIEDAKKVCRKLKIPHYTLDFSKHLEKEVIERFVSEYIAGRTPNPCVDCNRHLKFDILLKKALALGFDFLATGHYARIAKTISASGTCPGRGNGYILKRAKDPDKDQSYFLYSVRKSALKSVLFPLGDFTKEEVRAIAKKAKLPVHDKPASQDICFIPDKGRHEFLSERVNRRMEIGPIVTLEGDFLGKHKGACFYTVGQRSGLGGGYKHPLYVLSVNAEENQLVVGKKDDLKSKALVAGEINILAPHLPKRVKAQIRYNQKKAECNISPRENGNKLKVIFKEAQEAVAPGQSVVFYDGDTVLGGGIIEKVITEEV